MYTYEAIQSAIHRTTASTGEDSPATSLEAAQQAHSTLQEVTVRISELLLMASDNSASNAKGFQTTLDQVLTQIYCTRVGGALLFDGHIDTDLSIRGQNAGLVRLRVPNLIGELHQFHSNFFDVLSDNTAEFANAMRQRYSAVINHEASIQGVRLNTFLSRSLRKSPLAAVNSLTALNGLYALNYGSAMVAPSHCRDTHMPLTEGGISINGIAVPGCEGRVSALVESINLSMRQHGVIADGRLGERLVLIRPAGGRIDVVVSHQSCAILSGLSCGASSVAADISGRLVWVTFRNLNQLCFDTTTTAKFLNGDTYCIVPLRSGLLSQLSLSSEEQRLLAVNVLTVVKSIIDRELESLSYSLCRIQQLALGPAVLSES